jgi:hypothetical protein
MSITVTRLLRRKHFETTHDEFHLISLRKIPRIHNIKPIAGIPLISSSLHASLPPRDTLQQQHSKLSTSQSISPHLLYT